MSWVVIHGSISIIEGYEFNDQRFEWTISLSKREFSIQVQIKVNFIWFLSLRGSIIPCSIGTYLPLRCVMMVLRDFRRIIAGDCSLRLRLAWRIMDEPLDEKYENLSQLKLRLGWGITGQQNITNDYPYLPRYTSSWASASYILGTDTLITLRPEGYDPNIKWEETTTTNIRTRLWFP